MGLVSAVRDSTRCMGGSIYKFIIHHETFGALCKDKYL
jgi:hypothetical protein